MKAYRQQAIDALKAELEELWTARERLRDKLEKLDQERTMMISCETAYSTNIEHLQQALHLLGRADQVEGR